jgi:predicted HTH domain antitoxin
MNAGKARRIAIRTLDEFEELLNDKNVTIPSSDREGKERHGGPCVIAAAS